MKTQKHMQTALAILALAFNLSLLPQACLAQTGYNATTDFSVTNGNPNGVWSYGWMPVDFSSFNLYDHSYAIPDEQLGWRTSGADAPAIWKNIPGYPPQGIPAGWLSLHPGPGTQPSVLRWIAPAVGSVTVVGQFLPGDIGNMQVAVRLNNRSLWTAADSGGYALRTAVNIGDKIDFAVYGGYANGVTPVSAVVTYDNLAITVHPLSQVGYWGKSVTLSVTTSGGNPPYSYQWLKDGVEIEGATGSQLDLTNLQAENAGSYTVAVKDADNTTLMSQAANLTVKPAGVSIATYAGLTIDGVVDQTYGIQATTDLSNASGWSGVANVTLTQPTQIWYDSQSTAQQSKRFYRVVAGPVTIP